jgi:hypothetical protein
MVLTMPHAADREQAASTCGEASWMERVDWTTPYLVLPRAPLWLAQRTGVERVVLMGRAQVEGESALIGPWARRSLCPTGELLLDPDASRSLWDFDDFASLQAAAGDHQGPLRLRPDRYAPRERGPRLPCFDCDRESPL